MLQQNICKNNLKKYLEKWSLHFFKRNIQIKQTCYPALHPFPHTFPTLLTQNKETYARDSIDLINDWPLHYEGGTWRPPRRHAIGQIICPSNGMGTTLPDVDAQLLSNDPHLQHPITSSLPTELPSLFLIIPAQNTLLAKTTATCGAE